MLGENENSKLDHSSDPQTGRWLKIVVFGRNPRTTLIRLTILVAVCVVVFKFILLPIRVQGISMFPTYKNNSRNFVNRLAYLRHDPQRGDVVGIRLSASANNFFQTPGIMYMKRVVGLPGETVAFIHGRLFINGVVLAEPYVKQRCYWNAAPVAVGSNQYYVVGDNRSMPIEDHEHGKAEQAQIVGKVVF